MYLTVKTVAFLFILEQFLHHRFCAIPYKTVTGLHQYGVVFPISCLITNRTLLNGTLIQRDEKASGGIGILR